MKPPKINFSTNYNFLEPVKLSGKIYSSHRLEFVTLYITSDCRDVVFRHIKTRVNLTHTLRKMKLCVKQF